MKDYTLSLESIVPGLFIFYKYEDSGKIPAVVISTEKRKNHTLVHFFTKDGTLDCQTYEKERFEIRFRGAERYCTCAFKP